MKVNIRRINEWDAPAVLKLYAPFVGNDDVPDQETPTLAEMIQRIDRYTYGYGWLICEVDGIPSGFCYVTEHQAEPDNPFFLDLYLFVKADSQRRNIGTAMFSLLTTILEYGNRRTLFASVSCKNGQTADFLEYLGFKPIGSKENENLQFQYDLNPVNSRAEKTVKPYLIENKIYEAGREKAQNLVKP